MRAVATDCCADRSPDGIVLLDDAWLCSSGKHLSVLWSGPLPEAAAPVCREKIQKKKIKGCDCSI